MLLYIFIYGKPVKISHPWKKNMEDPGGISKLPRNVIRK